MEGGENLTPSAFDREVGACAHPASGASELYACQQLQADYGGGSPTQNAEPSAWLAAETANLGRIEQQNSSRTG